jgi:hypothetical protein
MSVRLTLYNDLKAKLITLAELIPDGLITHVGIWNSQSIPINTEERKQYNYPQVFIEFEKANYLEPKQKTYNTHIEKEQNYISNITLHIITHSLIDETTAFEEKETLFEDIKYAIKGMHGTNYGPLRLISDDYEKDHGNLFESQLIFSSLIQEPGVYDTQVEAHNPDEETGVWNDIDFELIGEFD